MPDCRGMRELKNGEVVARRLLNSTKSEDAKLMYGSWANESLRIQRLHWEQCEECEPVDMMAASAVISKRG